MHFGIQDEEHLSSCENNPDEHFEKELILDEPSCRTFMKNSGKQKEWSIEKKDEKSKVEALQWFDEALRRDKDKTWNSGKEKMKQEKSRIWLTSGIRNWIYSMKQEKELHYSYPSPI